MSSDTIIAVSELSKRYRLGHLARYDTLRDALGHGIRRLARFGREDRAGAAREDFWALRDVSFEVKRGEVIGIIGRNGAGKSTLLKILSRITEPTTGTIELRGRVASLLEVGTGFHPELSGRENVFLNGAILGMSRGEIRRKFDEIVAFAEVERFLDTPVKHYSSGMYVRLAFAVAAHLEPEILVVDEVLAVGDAQFQKKCLGKMRQVSSGEGRTVLFVSHNMPAVQALCQRALHLHGGRIVASGEVDPVISRYLADMAPRNGRTEAGPVALGSSLKLVAIRLPETPVKSGEPLEFDLDLAAQRSVTLAAAAVLVYSSSDARVAIMDLRPFGLPAAMGAEQLWRIRCRVSALPLVEGNYSIGLFAQTDDFCGDVYNLAQLIVRAKTSTDGFTPYSASHRGVIELEFAAESGPLSSP